MKRNSTQTPSVKSSEKAATEQQKTTVKKSERTLKKEKEKEIHLEYLNELFPSQTDTQLIEPFLASTNKVKLSTALSELRELATRQDNSTKYSSSVILDTLLAFLNKIEAISNGEVSDSRQPIKILEEMLRGAKFTMNSTGIDDKDALRIFIAELNDGLIYAKGAAMEENVGLNIKPRASSLSSNDEWPAGAPSVKSSQPPQQPESCSEATRMPTSYAQSQQFFPDATASAAKGVLPSVRGENWVRPDASLDEEVHPQPTTPPSIFM